MDGKLAGHADYHRRRDLIAFVHTEIDDAYEGQGLGGALVSAALDEVRDEGLAVLPFCPFVNSYIQRHPEYAEFVPEDYRERFGIESKPTSEEEE